MDILFLLICLCLILPKTTTAFTYFVKNTGKNQSGFCVTNESDFTNNNENIITPIPDIGNGDKYQAFKEYFLKYEQLKGKECSIGFNCSWQNTGFDPRTKFSDDLILDREWNYLPLIKTNGEISYQYPDGDYNLDGEKIHLSVLADMVFLLFTSSLKPFGEPGLILVLDAPDLHYPERQILVRDCEQVFFNSTPKQCVDTEIRGVDILQRGKKWVHLTFKIMQNETNFALNLSKGKKTWSLPDVITRSNFRFMGVRTNSNSGYFKFHRFPYLKSNANGNQKFVENSFSLKEATHFCVDVIYNGAGFAALINATGTEEPSKILYSNESVEWKTKRLEKDIIAGNYTFKVESHDEKFILRDVKYCHKRHPVYIIKYYDNFHLRNYGEITSCQSITNDKVVTADSGIIKSRKDLLEKEDLTKICTEAGNPDCKNVQACDQEGCFCLSGFVNFGDQKCSLECRNSTYGPNCVYKSEKSCLKMDKHFGTCEENNINSEIDFAEVLQFYHEICLFILNILVFLASGAIWKLMQINQNLIRKNYISIAPRPKKILPFRN